ncbi:MAG: hypothetical protein K2G86_07870 [Prevotella sp.]|nr:hypothetical protein [Prevotella sp.]
MDFNGSPGATPGGAFGRKTTAFAGEKSSKKTAKIFALETPGGLPGASSAVFPATNGGENIKKSYKKAEKRAKTRKTANAIL